MLVKETNVFLFLPVTRDKLQATKVRLLQANAFGMTGRENKAMLGTAKSPSATLGTAKSS